MSRFKYAQGWPKPGQQRASADAAVKMVDSVYPAERKPFAASPEIVAAREEAAFLLKRGSRSDIERLKKATLIMVKRAVTDGLFGDYAKRKSAHGYMHDVSEHGIPLERDTAVGVLIACLRQATEKKSISAIDAEATARAAELMLALGDKAAVPYLEAAQKRLGLKYWRQGNYVHTVADTLKLNPPSPGDVLRKAASTGLDNC